MKRKVIPEIDRAELLKKEYIESAFGQKENIKHHPDQSTNKKKNFNIFDDNDKFKLESINNDRLK